LHHGPTRGGAAESRKYRSWYDNTLESYRRYFGEPPQDLWPAAVERFDTQHDFVRVDRRDVVTLDRALLRRSAIATAVGSCVLAAAHALAQADDAARSAPGVWLGVLIVAAVFGAVFFAAARAGMARKRKEATARAATSKQAAGGASSCGFVAAPVLGTPSSKDPNGDNSGADGGQNGCGATGCGGGGGCGSS
jgi:hypothetical protein